MGLFLPDTNSINMVTKLFGYVIKSVALVLLLKNLDNVHFQKMFTYGIFAATIILFCSVIFSNQLALLGFKVSVLESDWSQYSGFNKLSFIRNYGFFGSDSNSLGVYYNLMLAFVIYNLDHAIVKKNHVLFTIFLFFAVLTTGSRMAFLTAILIILYFYIFSPQKNIPYILFILLIFVSLYSLGYMDFIFDRFTSTNQLNEISFNNELSRTTRWVNFLNYSYSSIGRLFFGYDTKFFAFGYGGFREPHNIFISILYYGGLFNLTFILFAFFSLFVSLIKSKEYRDFIFFIPVLISSMFLSSMSWIEIFLLLFNYSILKKKQFVFHKKICPTE